MRNSIQKRVKIILVLLLLFGLASISSFAQSKSVRGRVTNEKSEPVPNITILVKGTTNGTTTDENGDFLIKVPNNTSVLVFSSIGYESQELTVGTQSTINVTLKAGEASKLNEVVVVGYGAQRKVTVTGAVSTVKGTELEKTPTVNLSN